MKTTANDVVSLLKAKHAAPQWAFVENVCESTQNHRRCDAMAVGQWHSVGQHLHGFEVKVARSDWQREMQDVAKAETFARYCDYWWLVATEGVVKIEEMPERWGLMEVVGGGLKVRRIATKREPEPLSRGLLVMLTRRAAEQNPADAALKAAREEGWKEGYARGKETTHDARGYESLQQSVADFETASGVSIRHEWEAGKIGAAVKLVMAGADGTDRIRSSVESALRTLDYARERIGEYLASERAAGAKPS